MNIDIVVVSTTGVWWVRHAQVEQAVLPEQHHGDLAHGDDGQGIEIEIEGDCRLICERVDRRTSASSL